MVNPLEMSDEEFLALGDNTPTGTGSESETNTPAAEESPAEETNTETGAEAQDEELTEAEKAAAAEDVEDTTTAPTQENEKVPEKAPEAEPKPAEPAAPEAAAPAEPPNYEALYTKIMTPFKANGKSIEVRTPEEAVQLMQMGANYTRKMQELAPHRKALLMLEKNGLLDEGKLAFLIDIEKKNPEAIQKLVKDSGLDPMDIDTSKESTYREGAHRVDDAEVKFYSALDDLKSAPGGQETIDVMSASWDTASQDHLWAHPEAMATIHNHRTSGVYDRINEELGRQRTLGTIAADVPFLEAYRQVGEAMSNLGAFADLTGQPAAPPAAAAPRAPAVVATRVAAPKPTITNGDKAAAASAPRTTPKTAAPFVNPLAMSDDEFLRQFEGRV